MRELLNMLTDEEIAMIQDRDPDWRPPRSCQRATAQLDEQLDEPRRPWPVKQVAAVPGEDEDDMARMNNGKVTISLLIWRELLRRARDRTKAGVSYDSAMLEAVGEVERMNWKEFRCPAPNDELA
jgi:hypothetical protein